MRVDGKQLGIDTWRQLSKQLYAMVMPKGSIAISRLASGGELIIETGAFHCCLSHAATLPEEGSPPLCITEEPSRSACDRAARNSLHQVRSSEVFSLHAELLEMRISRVESGVDSAFLSFSAALLFPTDHLGVLLHPYIAPAS